MILLARRTRRTQILLTRRRGARGDLYISQFSQRENAIKSLSQFVRVGRLPLYMVLSPRLVYSPVGEMRFPGSSPSRRPKMLVMLSPAFSASPRENH